MDFLKFVISDLMGSAVAWFTVVGILTCWAFGVADIIKYGWSPKGDAE